MADDTLGFTPDPKLDLVLERVVEVPPELVWAAWTQPEHLKAWFTPAPWRTTHCEIDLRPGGIFRTVMEGPAGERFDGTGCYLEVVPNRRLAWTSVLLPNWRPAPAGGELPFTGIIELEPADGGGTRYTAMALHRDEEGCAQHAGMGFQEGWGKALDQLVAHMRGRS